jgi:diacylglycerol kinase
MTSVTGLANLAIEQVLELSADAHIERTMTAQDSAAFHRLTGAISAYGKALSVLVALEQAEEFYGMIGQLNLPGMAH